MHLWILVALLSGSFGAHLYVKSINKLATKLIEFPVTISLKIPNAKDCPDGDCSSTLHQIENAVNGIQGNKRKRQTESMDDVYEQFKNLINCHHYTKISEYITDHSLNIINLDQSECRITRNLTHVKKTYILFMTTTDLCDVYRPIWLPLVRNQSIEQRRPTPSHIATCNDSRVIYFKLEHLLFKSSRKETTYVCKNIIESIYNPDLVAQLMAGNISDAHLATFEPITANEVFTYGENLSYSILYAPGVFECNKTQTPLEPYIIYILDWSRGCDLKQGPMLYWTTLIGNVLDLNVVYNITKLVSTIGTTTVISEDVLQTTLFVAPFNFVRESINKINLYSNEIMGGIVAFGYILIAYFIFTVWRRCARTK